MKNLIGILFVGIPIVTIYCVGKSFSFIGDILNDLAYSIDNRLAHYFIKKK